MAVLFSVVKGYVFKFGVGEAGTFRARQLQCIQIRPLLNTLSFRFFCLAISIYNSAMMKSLIF